MDASVQTDENALMREMQHLRGTVERLLDKLGTWEGAMNSLSRKEQNAVRRAQYRQDKQRREEGLIPLPPECILKFRDKRLKQKYCEWAAVGMRFAAANKPLDFITWLVHQWNNCTYLKKPITFSSSSFRIWNGNCRFANGPRDLLHFTERKSTILLQSPAEHDDFRGRPFWDWAFAVMYPVYAEMCELGFDAAPEDFRRHVQLLLGGFGELQVYTDVYWDFQETRANINKCLQRVGSDFQRILRAVHTGLRIKGLESPVRVPSRRPEPSRPPSRPEFAVPGESRPAPPQTV